MFLIGEDSCNKDKLYYERQITAYGHELVAGVDEAGRGPLAGPVVAAAVLLPPGLVVEGADDSKKLTPAKRRLLETKIKTVALSWAIGMVFPPYLDEINILAATREAMIMAVSALSVKPQAVIVDALSLPISVPQLPLVKGDEKSQSVACASILAKEERDRIMVTMDELFPGYGFNKHKGYATREHIEALINMGPSPIHRKSFAPVRSIGLGSKEDGHSQALF